MHILYGRSSFPRGEYEISQLVPEFADRIYLQGGDSFSATLPMGDVNDDGYSDFALVTQAGFRQYNTHVIFGNASGVGNGNGIDSLSAATAEGHAVLLEGIELVTAMGDVDANGRTDFLVFETPSELGVKVILRMQALPTGGTVTEQQSDSWKTRILTNEPFFLLKPAGDFDGDGFGDILIEDTRADVTTVVYGGALAGFSEVSLQDIPASMVRVLSGSTPRFTGTSFSASGASVSVGFGHDIVRSGGDVNGDGFSDLVITSILLSLIHI